MLTVGGNLKQSDFQKRKSRNPIIAGTQKSIK